MTIIDTYNWLLDDFSDPRLKDWFMMSSPVPTVALVLAYLVICHFGPRFMEKRPAVNLAKPMIAYNFLLVGASVYMFHELLYSVVSGYQSWLCSKVDYSDSEGGLRLLSVIYLYYLSKLVEFMDTFFFILRKKNNQLTFLHVYHHATMPILWWLGTKYVGGGNSYFSAMLNCFVHVVMYFYYALSAFGPQMQCYLWWKKYITVMQLTQFVMVIMHISACIYLNCGYPLTYQYVLILYCFSQIALFVSFFKRAYIKPRKTLTQNGVPGTEHILRNGKKSE